MADAGLFIGWGEVVRGREDRALDVFNETLELYGQMQADGRIEARYAWLAEPDVPAGEMILTSEDGAIRKLVVTFDRGVTWD